MDVLGKGSGVGAFRSGLWLKDSVRGPDGQRLQTRFVNIGTLEADGGLSKVAIHEFDTDFRLTAVIHAEHGRYQPAHNGQASSWRLEGVETTRFNVSRTQTGYDALHAAVERRPETIWVSDLNPALLSVLAIAPDRMSALALWRYTSHLKENAQNANRYELALWKKVVYPLAIIVMLMLDRVPGPRRRRGAPPAVQGLLRAVIDRIGMFQGALPCGMSAPCRPWPATAARAHASPPGAWPAACAMHSPRPPAPAGWHRHPGRPPAAGRRAWPPGRTVPAPAHPSANAPSPARCGPPAG